jgi:phosphohistidine phosphatase
MLLHLVRHAHAVTAEENARRPLSSRGRDEIARLASFFTLNGAFRPAQVWHSPLLRARQTADDLVDRLELDPLLIEIPGLLPEDEPLLLAERLQEQVGARGDLALVGHEPHLSALASLLVRGKASPMLFTLKKGAVLTLEPAGSEHKKTGLARWRARWHISPDLLAARERGGPRPVLSDVTPPLP